MNAPAAAHLASLAEIDAEAPADALFTVFARLQSCREGRTKQGEPYVDVELADVTRAVEGKIWSNAGKALHVARTLARGTAVKVLFEVRTYKGAAQINVRALRVAEDGEEGFDPSRVWSEGFSRISDVLAQTLVFDIETVPDTTIRALPPTIAQAVTRAAERQDGEDGKVMSLSPWFGKIVSLAFADASRPADDMPVTVLAVPPPQVQGEVQREVPAHVRLMSEKELLQCFWTLAEHADVVVTYNGRNFDVPYVVVRSLVHGIPARKDLLSNPWGLRPHLDLYRVLTNGSNSLGPSSLDVVCWSLGLTSPKGSMDGSMVAPTYARGDIVTIAEYNAGDVRATAEVYRRVQGSILSFRHDW
jgi:predicted PolB exonuclease-like 3'-5' exonuclease